MSAMTHRQIPESHVEPRVDVKVGDLGKYAQSAKDRPLRTALNKSDDDWSGYEADVHKTTISTTEHWALFLY